MSEENKKDTDEGLLGTNQTPSGNNENKEESLSEEELLKKKIEELRRRDPFIYR